MSGGPEHKDPSRVKKSSFVSLLFPLRASLVAQMVKNPPAMPETMVRSLGGEEPLEEGNGNPLQCSGLENSMDRGTWWATVHRVMKNQI